MYIYDLDIALFRAVNGLTGRSDALDSVGVFFASPLIFLMAVAVLAAAWYRCATARMRGTWYDAARDIAVMLRAIAASAAAVGFNFLFSLAYLRERPFVALEGVTKLIGEPLAAKSLPSDHASTAFAVAMSVVMLRPKLGAALLVAATAVALGRVFVGVHHPSDVLAGIIVGSAAALAVRAIGHGLKDIEIIKKRLATGKNTDERI